jgi:peptidoglycan/LPS O-acetylase OafA/YrhL
VSSALLLFFAFFLHFCSFFWASSLQNAQPQYPSLSGLFPGISFPATVFFVMGGYTLSAALAAKAVKPGTWASFYAARFQALMPLYLLAVLLALINMLVTCRPETYSQEFSWQPYLETRVLPGGGVAECQSSPVEMPCVLPSSLFSFVCPRVHLNSHLPS